MSNPPHPPKNIVEQNCDTLKVSVHVHNTHKNSVSFEHENTLHLHYKDRPMKDVSLTTALDDRLTQSRYKTQNPTVSNNTADGWFRFTAGRHTAQQSVRIVTIVSWDSSVGTVTGLGYKIFEVRISVREINIFFYQNTQTGPGANPGSY
jgi:hypothetical protein